MEHRKMPGPGDRPRNALRTLARLFRCAARWKAVLYALLAATLAAIALDLAAPLLIEGCIDAIRFSGGFSVNRENFFFCFAALLAVAGLSALMGWLHGVLSSRLSLRIEADLREELFRKTVRLPLQESESRMPGDLMSRVMNDSGLAARAFSEALLSLLADGIVILGCAAVMLIRNAALAGITITATLASVFLTGFLSRFLFPAFFAQQTSLGILSTHIEETMRSFRTCAAGGRLEENRRRMERCSEEYYRNSVRAAKLEGLMRPLMLFLGNVNFLLVVVFGARSVLAGAMGLGTLQAFVLYSRQFMEPVNELGDCFAQAQSSLAGAERVFALLDCPDEPEGAKAPEAARTGKTWEPRLLLEDVRFAYRKDRPVLRGVDLELRRGERLALVGATGAGKTTLVSLLPRLYEGYEGRITLDGRELRELGLAEVRKRVAVVPQEPQIVAGTVYENLAYGAPDATAERVRRAAEAAGLAPMIDRLPKGYDTELDNGGEVLSQGQMQLLCLARALLRDAEVLILDESTSSVDAAMESALAGGMRALTAGKTCIVIAHRIASVTDADHICVLDGGRVAEYGTHAELMARKGRYYALFTTQFLGAET